MSKNDKTIKANNCKTIITYHPQLEKNKLFKEKKNFKFTYKAKQNLS